MQRLLRLATVAFFAAVFVVEALPVVRKDNNTGDVQPKTTQASIDLEEELGKLKQDGVDIQKVEQTVMRTVDGKTETSKTEQQTIADGSTGKVVAKVSKTVTTNENGQQKEAHVDVPSAGIHQDVQGSDVDQVELSPPDQVARYIFDTSDIDSVDTAIKHLVEKNKLSKKSANDYMNQIRDHLNVMHDEALKEMAAEMEERRQEQDQILKDMVTIADTLDNNADIEKVLYQNVKKLYMAYRTDGDEYAKDVLSQFTNLLQREVEAGNFNESVQDSIYDVILQALKDGNEELQNAGEEQQSEPAEAEKPKEKPAKPAKA